MSRHAGPAHTLEDAAAAVVGGAAYARGDPPLCPRCAGTWTCRACAQVRQRAYRLVHAERFGVEDTAARMGLSAALVRRLEKLHGEWLELTRLKLDSIPARCARDFLEAELRRRPGLTRAAVARRMGITQSELDRMVGYASTANSRPAAERRIGIAAASRLARALGRAPHELEGC